MIRLRLCRCTLARAHIPFPGGTAQAENYSKMLDNKKIDIIRETPSKNQGFIGSEIKVILKEIYIKTFGKK